MDHSAVTTPTYLGNMISAADNEALYDENAKLILADKSVLSWILRRCTNEFMNESLDTIRACIALMCNLSALVLEEGIQQGRQEGIQQGRQDGIREGIQQEKENSLYRIAKFSREYGIPMETTLSKLKSDKEWEDSEVDRVVQIVYSS